MNDSKQLLLNLVVVILFAAFFPSGIFPVPAFVSLAVDIFGVLLALFFLACLLSRYFEHRAYLRYLKRISLR